MAMRLICLSVEAFQAEESAFSWNLPCRHSYHGASVQAASVYVKFSHTHDVAYLVVYPIDGKFSKIRGLHQIEITDK